MPTIWTLLLLAGAALAQVTAITDCLEDASVPQALPGSSNFTFETNPYNLRVQYTPVAVALPTTVQHVQAAVSCAAKYKIRVSAKSGGHSYASFGLGGENGHVIVDFKYMYNVTVDPTTQIATLQAGCRLGNVAQALYAQGGRAMSHGTCPP
jgi:FAD/FMN-containing dehydrogenase